MTLNNFFTRLYLLRFHIMIALLPVLWVSCSSTTPAGSAATELRAPAYPLVTIDPYTSAWSMSDKLYETPVRHWTEKTHGLIGAVRVDGQVFRFLGQEEIPWKPLLPMANNEPWQGSYTFEQPAKGWEQLKYNDRTWKTGKAAFGTPGMQSLSTRWTTSDIWVRRTFNIALPGEGDVYLIYSHDDIFELYLNGTQLVKTKYEWHDNVVLKIDRELLNADGQNVIAAHCHNRTGGGYVDFGLYQENDHGEQFAQTAIQNSVSLSATQTHYNFTCGPVDLNVSFVSPLLPDDLDLLSRPVNYISYEVISNDGAAHEVQVYIEGTPQWAVHDISQEVAVESGQAGNVSYLKAGTTKQPVLQRRGDDVRIDWGYFYLAGDNGAQKTFSLGDYFATKASFIKNGKLPGSEGEFTGKMNNAMPSMAFTEDLGEVSSQPAGGYVLIGYDDVESIQYFGDNLKAWWTNNGTVTMNDVLNAAVLEYDDIIARCNAFDRQLWDEAISAGGNKYADLCVLAFRQSIAAHKLVRDTEGNLLFLSKENNSNGSIGTVDISYPSSPLYLKYNTELLKGMLNPIFHYSESGRWTKPFAAHDVGTYPLANGQTYGGDMPVEESGNMLIMAAAISHFEGNARYAEEHWETLTTWANYLLEYGLDPEEQLCTDDFAGHLAHNINLSVKAIMGIAGYGYMAGMLGKDDVAEKYMGEAKSMALQWMEMADDGDHYRLTFDKPGTWSQKYNLVWDKLLDLKIFPDEVRQKEIAYYLTKQNRYGLPLDSREAYTKSDWIVWTATLADDPETFRKLTDPLHLFVSEAPGRVPMTDWYDTNNARRMNFKARSVVGGYFIKMLEK